MIISVRDIRYQLVGYDDIEVIKVLKQYMGFSFPIYGDNFK